MWAVCINMHDWGLHRPSLWRCYNNFRITLRDSEMSNSELHWNSLSKLYDHRMHRRKKLCYYSCCSCVYKIIYILYNSIMCSQLVDIMQTDRHTRDFYNIIICPQSHYQCVSLSDIQREFLLFFYGDALVRIWWWVYLIFIIVGPFGNTVEL